MPTIPTADRLRVLLASEHALVADTVSAALTSRGHRVVPVPWSMTPALVPRGPAPQVGLLLCDLERWSHARVAAAIVERARVPWVALTNTPRGPVWGALLAAGVDLVVSSETRLAQIGDVLEAAVRQGAATPPRERDELETSWLELRAHRREMTRRVGALSAQEREVLRLLHEGLHLDQVAESLRVTRAEVRRHVDSVQGKLQVATRREAVAAFDDSLDLVGSGSGAEG